MQGREGGRKVGKEGRRQGEWKAGRDGGEGRELEIEQGSLGVSEGGMGEIW